MDEPSRGILNKNLADAKPAALRPPAFPTIKIEEPEQRGRSRSKNRGTSNHTSSASTNRSKSRSASRVSVKDQTFLKWTILNKDPSQRLHYSKGKGPRKTYEDNDYEDDDDEGEEQEREQGEEEEEEEDEEEVDEEEISDEEQVSDVENEIKIDEHLDYDLGSKVLPNFVSSISQVLDSMKPWLAKKSSTNPDARADIQLDEIQEGIHRAVHYMSKDRANTSATSSTQHTYVLYLDQMDDSFAEKMYSLVYTFGSILTNGDTLYIINQCDDDKKDMLHQLNRICDHIEYLFECTNGVGTLDKVDVVICSMYHPYPKQLLTEMAYSLQPTSIIIPLQTVVSSLQNFITSVPMLVIRKKLKRARRKGIAD